MKSLAPWVLAFALLIAAAIALANWDPITPAVVEARAETSVGPVTMDVFDQGLSLLAKLIGAAGLAGVMAFVWKEIVTRRELWWRENTTRRWRGGPNAQWRQQSALPKLKREDLMLLALSGKRLPQVQEREVEDDIKLDF